MRIKSLLKIETFDRFSEGSLNPLMFMDRSYLYIYRVAREKVEHVFMHEYLRNHISKLYQISMNVTYGLLLPMFLFWRRCYTLCTSGLVGGVIFFHNWFCGTGDSSRV